MITSRPIPHRPQKDCTVFFGPPGSGKGAQSGRLEVRHGIPRLEMGKHYRALKETSKDPHVLAEIAPIDHGGYVSDSFTIWQAKVWIARHKMRPHIVLDGAIRTLPQFEALYPFLVNKCFRIRAIWFSIRPKECFDRLLMNPRPGRTDDQNRSIILDRFRRYYAHTYPLKRIVRRQAAEFHEIVADSRSIDDVQREIEGILQGRVALQVA